MIPVWPAAASLDNNPLALTGMRLPGFLLPVCLPVACHWGEAQWGVTVLCHDGCLSSNVFQHPNQHVHMTSVCWFSVLHMDVIYSYFSAYGLNNRNDFRHWNKRHACKGFSCSFITASPSKLGVFADLDWKSVLAVPVCTRVGMLWAHAFEISKLKVLQQFYDYRSASGLITASISSNHSIRTACRKATGLASIVIL